jgi:alpha-L-fucosidase
MKRTTLLAAATFAALTYTASAQTTPTQSNADFHANETQAQRDARMKWWREARFGMFIHWGIYSVPAGTWDGQRVPGLGEWIMSDAKIPVAPYSAFANNFNPTQFDADRIVALAKAAGMKYIVVTAKHHDGFAMYRSKASAFNIYDATPFKRDPLEELAIACRKQGLRLGLYYSQAQDWTAPGGGNVRPKWDPAQNGDLGQYIKTKAAPQVRELIEKYQPVELWWDTPVTMSKEDIAELTAAFPLVPNLIVNNRLGNGAHADIETPEQYIPATGIKGKDWEVCMTMNDTWGYKSFDHNYKSGASLLRNLIDIASKGGNYLLNIGPDATGVVPQPQVERLQEFSRWMKANSASIYATTASPFARLPFNGRATVKGSTLYLNVFEWPEGGLILTGLQTPVREARALATKQKLEVLRAADGTLRISKPGQIDAVSTVIALQLTGAPVVVIPETLIAPSVDGSFTLKALDANIDGETLQVEGEQGRQNLGYWTNEKDAPSWQVQVLMGAPKGYKVQMNYASQPGDEGSTFALQVDDTMSGVTGTVAATGSWSNYKTVPLDGTLTLAPGKHKLRIVVLRKQGYGVMNLRGLTLLPAA